MSSEDSLVQRFKRVGLGEKKAVEITKNKKVCQAFVSILDEAGVDSSAADEKTLNLLQGLAVESKAFQGDEGLAKRPLVTRAVVDGRLKTPLQLSEAVKYVLSQGAGATDEGMCRAAGVGVELTRDDVKAEILRYVEAHREAVVARRYAGVPALLGETKKLDGLKWAAPGLFKPIIDEIAAELFGPRDARDVVKKEKKKKAPAVAKDAQAPVPAAAPERSMYTEGFLGDLHRPGENPQAYPELMAEHLAFTKGKTMTRFPPEPNGFLHIGHSKAIMVNFGYAQHHGGHCYLRFDDTNPEAEEAVYFNSIKSMVEWLGFAPWKITYSSDYFDRLYELAQTLIAVGKAYVCHCTAEQVKAQRGMRPDGTLGGERFACAHRAKPVAQNREEFEQMRDGRFQPGEATLRMKQDLESPSPQMWDLVAYRVLNAPHHRTGDRWRIYPTYDFTHCLVDSFENISHSLCTTEFRLSRESYEWLCDAVHVYRPAQREYGRLNITGTVLSKRKIAKLVAEGHVRAWDDPRLYTLESIKRRGVPPGAILSFINTLGVTTSTTNIQAVRFESAVRLYLDLTTPRLMLVLDPVLCEIDNVPEDFEEPVHMPYKPGADAQFGTRHLPFSKRFYIDRSDYRDEVDRDYFRLAPGQPVGLMKVPFNVSVKSVVRDAAGRVEKLVVSYDRDVKKKPKTYIQWVGERNCKPVKEVRIYNQLFNSENPAAHPDGYLKDINEDSEEVVRTAVVEAAGFDEIEAKSPLNVGIEGSEFNIQEKKGPETVRFQALRIGYFCMDKDSNGAVVLNRIVTLKEDSAKN
ncbi:glutaminyl-tRNA synthetase [Metschnikowia bicuspidata var. bicuspidata NRRL YB-4993]|uniref:glutamine--tRNA ligase n=1 Tax=Metschnikowia bicuspidata var. bicuspidata NRRL YB-4993 TaxID=869754 RepID=A0A1A0H9J6_9ASCO|nr:glutaminyl-tRNA synthetase [Metschnikowia bicuspidata var. bicuspidata NRRL YB-4993]OBA20665.1 glutaminyl-tRNA synthetase [Metschnikowia bicuspidata var. bicuspidata NRRL YB-4993]